jgi:predicted RNA binding protein YcfA (HicA-like mRNA interferase family)
MTCDEMVRLLKSHGWRVRRTTGHIQMEHPDFAFLIPIPNHGRKELATGTAQKILKDAGLK